MSFLINPFISYPFISYPYDTDAQAFIDAVATLTTPQEVALNDLVVSLKADGLWSKLAVIYPFIGGTASAHKFNLKNPVDSDAAHRMVFYTGGTGSVTHDSNGVYFVSTSDVNGSYANTFWFQSDYVADNTYYDFNGSFYNNIDLTTVSRGAILAAIWNGESAASPQLVINRNGAQMLYWGYGPNKTSTLPSPIIPSATMGLAIATTSGDGINDRLFWNGTLSRSWASGTRLSRTDVDKPQGLNTNINGSAPWTFSDGYPPDLSTARYAWAAFGATILTDTDVANLNTIVTDYEIALGRHV